MMEHIRSETVEKFNKAFDTALSEGKGCAIAARNCKTSVMKLFDEQCEGAIIQQAEWDSSTVRDKLSHDIDAHSSDVRNTKLSDLSTLYESKLKEALYGPVEALLQAAYDDTWPAIKNFYRRETETAVSECSAALSGFEMSEDSKKDFLSKLKNHARDIVEQKAKEEAGSVLYLMKERFTNLFNHDNDGMPRVWTGKEDIRAITKTARSSSLKLLFVLAAIRLDGDADKIADTLVHSLLDSKKVADKSCTANDPFASSTWEKVPGSRTLITPVQCKSLWSQFQKDKEYTVTQAISSQETAQKRIMARAKRKINSRNGSKSTIRYHVERGLDLGSSCGQIETWYLTHWDVEKGWASTDAAAKYEEMLKLRNENSVDSMSDKAIMEKVLRRNSVRLGGWGRDPVTGKSTSITESNRPTYNQLATRVQHLEATVGTMHKLLIENNIIPPIVQDDASNHPRSRESHYAESSENGDEFGNLD